MSASTNTTTTFTPRDCPCCGEKTSLTHLGTEGPREICGRFGCEWDGRSVEE